MLSMSSLETFKQSTCSLQSCSSSTSGISGSAGIDPYKESREESVHVWLWLSSLYFFYFRQTFLALSSSHFCFLYLVYSSCNCDLMPIWFKILVVQPAPYCTLSAAAIDRCWKDSDCTLLKYFPPSILHQIDIKFSEMLVVLLLTSWAALDTNLSPHDSTSLIKSGGDLSKASESV